MYRLVSDTFLDNGELDVGAKRRRLSVSNGRLCEGACEIIPRRFAHCVPLFHKIVISPLVCVFLRTLSFVPRTPPTPNRFRL